MKLYFENNEDEINELKNLYRVKNMNKISEKLKLYFE